jgi:hypothetical protein
MIRMPSPAIARRYSTTVHGAFEIGRTLIDADFTTQVRPSFFQLVVNKSETTGATNGWNTNQTPENEGD